MGGSDSSASTSLAPGFRFHPTDEELVSYYLKRKICGKPFRFDAITEIDIYKVEPWDLPGLSKLKTRDLEWYFFSGLDKKYGNGSRTNRATGEGYWKTTGKDRPVHHRSCVVGMKKTLVYHQGRAPRGKRSNWVMHEYRLVEEALEKAGFALDGFVLCRIFQKSGTGPKNGEQYGAPFVEEEWENENVETMVPGEVTFEDPCVDDDAFFEQNDLDQKLDLQGPGNVDFPVPFYHEASNNSNEDSWDVTGSDQKSLVGESEDKCGLQVIDEQVYGLPVNCGSSADPVKNEHVAQPDDMNNDVWINCLSNELSLDAVSDAPFDDGLYFDATDFLDTGEENPLDFGAFETFLDDDIEPYLHLDSPPEVMGSDADPAFLNNKENYPATLELPSASHQLPSVCSDGMVPSSEQVTDVQKSESDMRYPFLSQASRLLGNISAPPAFASEFPAKDLAARLSAGQSSSVRVTAGMIRITDMGGSGLRWSIDKAGNVNFLLSFEVPEVVTPVGLESLSRVFLSKMGAAISRGGSWFMFLWVILAAASYKIGTSIFAK